MRILSVASRLPDHPYSQETITGALLAYWNGALGEKSALLQRFHSRARVKRRHLAFPIERYPELDTWGKTNRAWFDAAEELGVKALGGACPSRSETKENRSQN
jgi:alkylresorcinol/alkylpyrone synthase